MCLKIEKRFELSKLKEFMSQERDIQSKEDIFDLSAIYLIKSN